MDVRSVIGWDIGGVNTKVARVDGGKLLEVRGRPYELQRAPDALVPLLRALATEVGSDRDVAHAVTMTAELSQMFRTKREGVGFVLDAVETAFPSNAIHVFTVNGDFVTTETARRHPLLVAAANWSATAHAVARHHRDALLVDTGTTTTDIIPIAGGKVVACGRTDPERLASGELVYTGAVRTPTEAIAGHVLLGNVMTGVSAEGFALAADVHVWRGHLDPADYTTPTPDGRAAAREFAGERLARVVCGDREMLDEAAVSQIAGALAEAQVATIAAAIRRVLWAHPSLRTAVVTGVGAFLGEDAARAAGLQVVRLADSFGAAAARCAPAACVALLLHAVGGANREAREPKAAASALCATASLAEAMRRREAFRDGNGVVRPVIVDAVVKIGGKLLADVARFEAVLEVIGRAARQRRLVIVPGGGPFADAVRDADRRVHLSDDAAHWMAILAMDQYAHVIAERVDRGRIVGDARGIDAALASDQVPVIAPSRWLREADPLPHSWDVTSDSISAWIAGQVGSKRLVIVKPAGASGISTLDPYFDRVRPAGITTLVVAADRIAEGIWSA